MQTDKWKDTLAMIKEKFTVLDEGREEIEDIPNGSVEFIEFDGPQGRIKIEFVITPVVLDKKTIYNKTGATASNVQYTYSDEEFTNRMNAYKWNSAIEEWEEMKPLV